MTLSKFTLDDPILDDYDDFSSSDSSDDDVDYDCISFSNIFSFQFRKYIFFLSLLRFKNGRIDIQVIKLRNSEEQYENRRCSVKYPCFVKMSD